MPKKKDDKKAAKELGYMGAETAASHAGADWKREAYELFVSIARDKPFFTTEDVRLGSSLREPPDRRAWGAIARSALSNEIIDFFRYEPSTSRICHGRLLTIWKSLIYRKRHV